MTASAEWQPTARLPLVVVSGNADTQNKLEDGSNITQPTSDPPIDQQFAAEFSRSAARFGSAPGRVNLIGEHVDYNGGLVLPTAIDRRVRVALRDNDTGTHRIVSHEFGERHEREAQGEPSGAWSDYAYGALTQATRQGWLAGGADLYVVSDLPAGAGVSSSAALISAVLRALAPTEQPPEPEQLAALARWVETDFIGVPCGTMDQLAVALTEPGVALALDTRNDHWERITIPADWAFTVVHSGVRRQLADGRYRQRVDECDAIKRQLGTQHICLVGAPSLLSLGERLDARLRHVVSEHERVIAARTAMREGAPDKFGALMNASHASYSHDFAASTPEIDALVQDAVALGATGARLTGGGFGGCIVVLTSHGDASALTAELLERHPRAFLV